MFLLSWSHVERHLKLLLNELNLCVEAVDAARQNRLPLGLLPRRPQKEDPPLDLLDFIDEAAHLSRCYYSMVNRCSNLHKKDVLYCLCFMCCCLVYLVTALVVVLEGGVVRPLDTPLLAVLDLLPASQGTPRVVLVEAVVDVIEQRLADTRVGHTRHHDEVGRIPLALDTGGDVVLAGLLGGGEEATLRGEWGGHVAIERVELLGGHLEGGEGGHLVLDDLGTPENQGRPPFNFCRNKKWAFASLWVCSYVFCCLFVLV